MPPIVDAHCHLEHPDFSDDIDQVIERAKAAGVTHIITNGVDPRTNRLALALSKKYDIVQLSMSIYPPDALANEVASGEFSMKTGPFDIDEEIKFIGSHKEDIIAVGEAGLDFATGDRPDEQKEIFRRMIALAIKLDKPIVVHSRKAERDAVEILEESGVKRVMMHCFHGKFKLVERIIENGWYITIPTNVVRSEHFQKIVKEIDISRLLTETDAPYLSPFKDKRNEPAFITESIKKIAELKGMDQEEVKNNMFLNFQRLFL
jgi:TatD DNase family protein